MYSLGVWRSDLLSFPVQDPVRTLLLSDLLSWLFKTGLRAENMLPALKCRVEG